MVRQGGVVTTYNYWQEDRRATGDQLHSLIEFYVKDWIDLEEFERRVELVLRDERRVPPRPERPSPVKAVWL